MSARIDLNNTSQTLAPPKRGRGRPRKNPPPPALPRPPDPDTEDRINRVQAAVAKAHLRAFEPFRALPDPPQYTWELGLPLQRKEELVKDDDSHEDWDPSKRMIHRPGALEMMKTKRGGDDLTRRPYKSRRAHSGGDPWVSFLEQIQMWKTKISQNCGADFTTRLHKRRRGCNGTDEITESSSYGGREITESLTSGDLHGDSNENIWSRCCIYDDHMPKLSKSVASLALCHGNTVLFACSGLAIERKVDCTKFLTSGSLARALNGAKEGHDNLKIKVRHEGYEVHQGDLAEYDTNFSIVTVRTFLDVYVVRGPEIQPCGWVQALGRDNYGKLLSRTVILDGDLKPSEDNEDPTCMAGVNAWEGGPLFTCDGNFVGMSLFFVGERACFVSRGTILEWLDHTSMQWSKGFKGFRSAPRPVGQKSNSQQEGYIDVHGEEQFLDSMGYPRPPITRDDGMILVNTFEETFGDTYPDGVWCEFSKKASSNIGRYVVALASFNGEKRCFACTGFFIEWNGGTSILTSASLVRSSSDENKIDENLRIEVLLPKNRHVKGTLLHYSLHYNVALVSVEDYRAVRPAIVRPLGFSTTKVAAVGRCFKSGALMAKSGSLVSWTGTLDCQYIVRSAIKITKAGIGGPLVNLDGEVVGMNFYDTRIGTPYLPWSIIDIILARFEEKSKSGEAGSDSDPSGVAFWKLDGDHTDCLNRWPVPVPGWCHPQDLDGDPSDEFCGYDYVLGKKAVLF